jgi:hypothetical protein
VQANDPEQSALASEPIRTMAAAVAAKKQMNTLKREKTLDDIANPFAKFCLVDWFSTHAIAIGNKCFLWFKES